MPDRLVLASASAARAAILAGTGLAFMVADAAIDETTVKRSFQAAGAETADCALALALAKAQKISARDPEALVLGADQILVCEGAWFDKPADLAAARRQLVALRGRRHELVTAVCATLGGARIWHHVSRPCLTMRSFSEGFLDGYLAAEGEAVLGSVGAYRLEGRGVQLFSAIEGDYFAILGLPVLPLLAFLRDCRMLAA